MFTWKMNLSLFFWLSSDAQTNCVYQIVPVSGDKEMEEYGHLQLAEVCSNTEPEASSECHEVP